MFQKKLYRFAWMLSLACALALGSASVANSAGGLKRLSLNPYAAGLENGAFIIQTGFEGPLRLPDTRPGFWFGFTIPSNYKANGTLIIELLWETSAVNCDVVFRSSSIFRAGIGKARDGGLAAVGLEPLDATVPFFIVPETIAPTAIAVTTPAIANQTEAVRFNILPTPGEFEKLEAGDGINFSIIRESLASEDTCDDQEIGIAGVSVLYK